MVKHVTQSPSYVIAKEPIINQQNWDAPEHLAVGQRNMHRIFRTVALDKGSQTLTLTESAKPLDLSTLTFNDPLLPEQTLDADTFLNRRLFNDALLVYQNGEVIHESYRNGQQARDRHVIHSCTKSFCAMIAAIAIDEQQLSADDLVSHWLPQFKGVTAWDGVTVTHLLNMTAGLDYSEDYTDPNAHYWRYTRAAGYYPPLKGETAIGVKAWVSNNLIKRAHEPGSTFLYNSCLTNVLGMVLEQVYQTDLASLFESTLYQHVGAEYDAWFNTDPQGFPITEGQLNLTLRDFARWASLMINDGQNLAGKQILPKGFAKQLVTTDPVLQTAYHALDKDSQFTTAQYRHKFWVFNPDQTQFTMLGIHGQFAWYDLNRSLMIVGQGSFPKQDGWLKMACLKQLWNVVGRAVDERQRD